MVDVDNLKALDPDTRSELLMEFRETAEYQSALLKSIKESAFIARKIAEITDPLDYYKRHIGEYRDIFRMIITHPHMDHMSGLHRIHDQEPTIELVNFWHSGAHDFDLSTANWEGGPYDRRDWETYKTLRTSAQSPKALKLRAGAEGDFFTADGVALWAPTPELDQLALDRNDQNILSMVLKISYRGRSIVLGGDATADETWPAIYPHIDMRGIDILKASHHGRKSGYYYPAVKEMSPWLTITSVGEKAHDATNNYRRYSQHTVSLRYSGTIRIEITDDGRLLYWPDLAQWWKPQLA